MLKNSFYFLCLCISIFFLSCAKDTISGDINFENNPLKNRVLFHSFSNIFHQIELYARDTILYEGYNDILIRIKDKDENYISYAEIEWKAYSSDSIYSPFSKIIRSIDNPDVYTSFLIFPTNTSDKNWALEISYQIQSSTYFATTFLTPQRPDSNQINIQSQIGLENKEYIVALVDPYFPIRGNNNCSILVYEKISSSEYINLNNLNIIAWNSSENYTQDRTFEIDFRPITEMYQGKIEIPDSGLWQLNLTIKDNKDNVILANEKSAKYPESSLHFPLLTTNLLQN